MLITLSCYNKLLLDCNATKLVLYEVIVCIIVIFSKYLGFVLFVPVLPIISSLPTFHQMKTITIMLFYNKHAKIQCHFNQTKEINLK